VTVSCADPTPLWQQCRNTSIQNSITGYYSWFGGSYWTCGDIWNDSSLNQDQQGALAFCNAQVDQCVQNTLTACNAAGMPRAANPLDVQHVEAPVAP
jgi:hypothetical protein